LSDTGRLILKGLHSSNAVQNIGIGAVCAAAGAIEGVIPRAAMYRVVPGIADALAQGRKTPVYAQQVLWWLK
jgi:hypothetical protein